MKNPNAEAASLSSMVKHFERSAIHGVVLVEQLLALTICATTMHGVSLTLRR